MRTPLAVMAQALGTGPLTSPGPTCSEVSELGQAEGKVHMFSPCCPSMEEAELGCGERAAGLCSPASAELVVVRL